MPILNVLKKVTDMKKIFFILAFLFPMISQAQVLDMSRFLKPLTMSKRFVKRLEKCLPFEETQHFTYMGTEIALTYHIFGKTPNKDCEFEVISDTSLDISASQICYFPQEELEQFLEYVHNLSQKSALTLENIEEFARDSDYRAASALMENKKYCDYYRDRIDFTQKIRSNLMDCRPTWENQKFDNIEIARKIIGKNGSTCQFEEVISFNRSDIEKLAISWRDNLKNKMDYEEEQTFLYTCQFDDTDLGELRDIFASMIIPEGKTFDRLSIIPPREILDAEPDFIIDRCELEKL